MPPDELDLESLHSGVSLELDFGVSPELLDVVEPLDVTELLDAGVSFELELDCTALDLGVSPELLGVSLLELEFTALDWGLSLELEGGTTELEEAGSMMVVVFSESFNTILTTWILAVLIVSGTPSGGFAVRDFKLSNMVRNAEIESWAAAAGYFMLVPPFAFFHLISAAANHLSNANSNDLEIMISSELYCSFSIGGSDTKIRKLFVFVES